MADLAALGRAFRKTFARFVGTRCSLLLRRCLHRFRLFRPCPRRLPLPRPLRPRCLSEATSRQLPEDQGEIDVPDRFCSSLNDTLTPRGALRHRSAGQPKIVVKFHRLGGTVADRADPQGANIEREGDRQSVGSWVSRENTQPQAHATDWPRHEPPGYAAERLLGKIMGSVIPGALNSRVCLWRPSTRGSLCVPCTQFTVARPLFDDLPLMPTMGKCKMIDASSAEATAEPCKACLSHACRKLRIVQPHQRKRRADALNAQVH